MAAKSPVSWPSADVEAKEATKEETKKRKKEKKGEFWALFWTFLRGFGVCAASPWVGSVVARGVLFKC